ncbi:hypothetical protein DNTS_014421 [Danionella cerebrum]|uniref:Ig-like domain-containing protein n=1 Tax=Danionella cerebrum TaxID=2873325 RepID=A0A553MXH8_9TELE|nr:hypothetical protein DNTS_014421 [Danionella translucida]
MCGLLVKWILLHSIGLSVTLKVIQTPADLHLHNGQTLNITCSHNDKSQDKIFWYQQLFGQNLLHIGFLTFKQPVIDIKGFIITGDAEKEGILTLPSVKAEHSAVYFCAGTPYRDAVAPAEPSNITIACTVSPQF